MLGKSSRHVEPVARPQEPVLEVSASMQGSLSFKDPVNLRISGRFDGSLDTLGSLTIGDRAHVDAQITGETIVIAGHVKGKIVARRQLSLVAPAQVSGELWTPRLTIGDGAVFEGSCHMQEMAQGEATAAASWMSLDDVAQYLEVESSVVRQWATQGRIPAVRDGESWRFEKRRLDQWVASERSG